MKLRIIAFIIVICNSSASFARSKPRNEDLEQPTTSLSEKNLMISLVEHDCITLNYKDMKFEVKATCEAFFEDTIDDMEIIAGNGWCVGGTKNR